MRSSGIDSKKKFAKDFELSRCRPALGTFVEISASGSSEAALLRANREAFRSIDEISRRMSFHDPESELSRLNRARVGTWIRVSRGLGEVLAAALEFQRLSDGRFNVAVGEPLTSWGILPGARREIRWRDLRESGFEVKGTSGRRIADVKIDLGGIAKGYAVDRAVEAILKCDPRISGIVNAGGDLRVFGSRARRVWIRSENERTLEPLRIRNAALATSAVIPSMSPAMIPGGTGARRISAYVDLARQAPLLRRKTVTVRAESCMTADALTKIALLVPAREAEKIARHYRARIQVHS